MFRDNHIASQEKRIAELQEELAKAKAGDKEMLEKLQAAQNELRRERAKRIPRGTFRDRLPSLPKFRWPFPMPFTIAAMFVLACFCFVGYHYFTDIQEGVVTGTEYHPPHTDCTTGSDGYTECHTTAESWTVDIAYGGRTATWGITEEESHRLHRGQWYCYTDLFHYEEDCNGPPSD